MRSCLRFALNSRSCVNICKVNSVQLPAWRALLLIQPGTTSMIRSHRSAHTESRAFSVLAHRSFSSAKKWSDEELKKIVDSNRLVVFMKGVPQAPQCGFSKYVIEILRMHGMDKFVTLNVLEDEVLRSRIKEFSNWPTIPQVYMNGEFIGGFDILLQMHKNGELVEALEKIGHRSILLDKTDGEGSDKK